MTSTSLRDLAAEIGEIAEQKRAAYGDSIASSGAALALLYPQGIPPEALDDVLLLARIWDKMQRIATGSVGEESPYLDIAGYGLCGVALHQTKQSLRNTKSRGILHGWHDNASGPDASPSSQEPPASARPLTSRPTTPNANAPAVPETSPPPSDSSPAPANVPAATATASANPSAAVRTRVRDLLRVAETANRRDVQVYP